MRTLIAVDSSSTAENAFEWYCKNFHRGEGYEVVMVHCRRQPSLPRLSSTSGMQFPSESIQKILNDTNKDIARLKDKYVVKCQEKHIKIHKCHFELEQSNRSGESVVKMAEEDACDMIVIGSRGEGKQQRKPIGSVADYVLHHAKVPVLLFPKPYISRLSSLDVRA